MSSGDRPSLSPEHRVKMSNGRPPLSPPPPYAPNPSLSDLEESQRYYRYRTLFGPDDMSDSDGEGDLSKGPSAEGDREEGEVSSSILKNSAALSSAPMSASASLPVSSSDSDDDSDCVRDGRNPTEPSGSFAAAVTAVKPNADNERHRQEQPYLSDRAPHATPHRRDFVDDAPVCNDKDETDDAVQDAIIRARMSLGKNPIVSFDDGDMMMDAVPSSSPLVSSPAAAHHATNAAIASVFVPQLSPPDSPVIFTSEKELADTVLRARLTVAFPPDSDNDSSWGGGRATDREDDDFDGGEVQILPRSGKSYENEEEDADVCFSASDCSDIEDADSNSASVQLDERSQVEEKLEAVASPLEEDHMKSETEAMQEGLTNGTLQRPDATKGQERESCYEVEGDDTNDAQGKGRDGACNPVNKCDAEAIGSADSTMNSRSATPIETPVSVSKILLEIQERRHRTLRESGNENAARFFARAVRQASKARVADGAGGDKLEYGPSLAAAAAASPSASEAESDSDEASMPEEGQGGDRQEESRHVGVEGSSGNDEGKSEEEGEGAGPIGRFLARAVRQVGWSGDTNGQVKKSEEDDGLGVSDANAPSLALDAGAEEALQAEQETLNNGGKRGDEVSGTGPGSTADLTPELVHSTSLSSSDGENDDGDDKARAVLLHKNTEKSVDSVGAKGSVDMKAKKSDKNDSGLPSPMTLESFLEESSSSSSSYGSSVTSSLTDSHVTHGEKMGNTRDSGRISPLAVPLVASIAPSPALKFVEEKPELTKRANSSEHTSAHSSRWGRSVRHGANPPIVTPIGEGKTEVVSSNPADCTATTASTSFPAGCTTTSQPRCLSPTQRMVMASLDKSVETADRLSTNPSPPPSPQSTQRILALSAAQSSQRADPVGKDKVEGGQSSRNSSFDEGLRTMCPWIDRKEPVGYSEKAFVPEPDDIEAALPVPGGSVVQFGAASAAATRAEKMGSRGRLGRKSRKGESGGEDGGEEAETGEGRKVGNDGAIAIAEGGRSTIWWQSWFRAILAVIGLGLIGGGIYMGVAYFGPDEVSITSSSGTASGESDGSGDNGRWKPFLGKPTGVPTSLPTALPKVSTTSKAPSPRPSTVTPSLRPTLLPTVLPTTAPPVVDAPSRVPALVPTSPPTASDGHGTFSFYVMGDGPYIDRDVQTLEEQLMQLSVNPNPTYHDNGAVFAVHLGDIMKGGDDATCERWKYERIEEVFVAKSSLPILVLPGDNDWIECPKPSTGWERWEDSFKNIEMNWSESSAFPSLVERQNTRPENFAFVHGGILFIGINTIDDEVDAVENDLEKRMNQNARWVRNRLVKYTSVNSDNGSDADEEVIRAIVLFGHSLYEPFFAEKVHDPLVNTGVPVLFFHADDHEFKVEQGLKSTVWDDFWSVQLDPMGIAPPIKITVQGTSSRANGVPLEATSSDQRMLGDFVRLDRRGGTREGPLVPAAGQPGSGGAVPPDGTTPATTPDGVGVDPPAPVPPPTAPEVFVPDPPQDYGDASICRPATSDISSKTHLQPVDGSEVSRIAFGSCFKPNGQISDELWRDVREEFRPDLWIWLGDNMYAAGNDMDAKREGYNEARDDEYYSEYGPLGEPKIPVTGTWDDNDFGGSNGGKNYACPASSQAEFVTHFNIPESDPRHPAQGEKQRWGVYSSNMFAKPNSGGENGIHVINLDGRSHRSPTLRKHGVCEGPESTMLGSTQWKWFEEEMLHRPSIIKVISTGVQVLPPSSRARPANEYCAYDGQGGTFDAANLDVGEGPTWDATTYESWAEIPQERTRLLRLAEQSINTGMAKHVIFLSGEQHWGEIMAKSLPPANDGGESRIFYEVTASGIDQNWIEDIDNPARVRVRSADKFGNGPYHSECNFPFSIDGKEYNDCADIFGTGKPGCSTRTDDDNVHDGNWGNCLPSEEELVPRERSKFGRLNKCTDNYFHTCSARANYGGLIVDWDRGTIRLSVFTPHEREVVASSITFDL